jgi:hypothetical protein
MQHFGTNRKVAGSISDEVITFFNPSNPSSRSVSLKSTQSLTEMITRKYPEGKGTPTGA